MKGCQETKKYGQRKIEVLQGPKKQGKPRGDLKKTKAAKRQPGRKRGMAWPRPQSELAKILQPLDAITSNFSKMI